MIACPSDWTYKIHQELHTCTNIGDAFPPFLRSEPKMVRISRWEAHGPTYAPCPPGGPASLPEVPSLGASGRLVMDPTLGDHHGFQKQKGEEKGRRKTMGGTRPPIEFRFWWKNILGSGWLNIELHASPQITCRTCSRHHTTDFTCWRT